MHGIAILLVVLCWTIAGQAQTVAPRNTERIVVSQNHRFLETVTGEPFFWLADTAWLLFQKLDRDEAERYLENRRAKGFNVVQAVALWEDPAVIPTAAAKPGAYWDHIDWIIDRAAGKGISIALVPAWGSLLKSGTLNERNAAAYAGFLASRYAGKPNIFWILGGDIRGDDYPEVWRSMGRTLMQADPIHLISYHPFGRTQSSLWFHAEPWLAFNMFQSGHRRYGQDLTPGAKGEDNWRYVQEDYARTPPKPTLDAEPSYEGIPQGLHDTKEPYWTDRDCRRYAYWSVFAGACGHTYGHNAVMQMHKPDSVDSKYGPRSFWYEMMDAPGAAQMQHLKKLMLSRPYLERIPDQSLLAGENGDRYDRVVATRGQSYAFLYTYTGRPFEVRFGVLTGSKLRAQWFDPRTGATQPIGVFPNQGRHKFTPPGQPAPGNDWVLILDDDH